MLRITALSIIIFSLSSTFPIYGSSPESKCKVGGCNNELCITKCDNWILSTCIWKAKYSCYHKYGICEADAQGQCSWRQTKELVSCIESAENKVFAADPFPD
jgi:hypothetical protein